MILRYTDGGIVGLYLLAIRKLVQFFGALLPHSGVAPARRILPSRNTEGRSPTGCSARLASWLYLARSRSTQIGAGESEEEAAVAQYRGEVAGRELRA